jgi:hypothetical protein
MCIAAGQDLVHVAVALPIVRPVGDDAVQRPLAVEAGRVGRLQGGIVVNLDDFSCD